MKTEKTICRYIILTILTLVSSLEMRAQDRFEAKVDLRAELVSLVFKLAGAKEYQQAGDQVYAKAVDKLCPLYINHDVVKYARELMGEGVVREKPMEFAAHLLCEKGKLSINPNIVEDKEYRSYWTQDRERKFFILLKDFYKQTKFEKFFEEHADYYRSLERKFGYVSQVLDTVWVDNFCGKKNNVKFYVMLSVLNGPQNYGVQYKLADGTIQHVAVLGDLQDDTNNTLSYDQAVTFPELMQQILKSYSQSLVEKFWSSMQTQASSTYNYFEDDLKKIFCAKPQEMINETLSRSMFISYLLSHNSSLDKETYIRNEELKNSMVMTRKFVAALEDFKTKRNQYSTVDEFMPEIVKVVQEFDAEAYLKQYFAHVVKCSVTDGQTDFNYGILDIVVEFDHPMSAYTDVTECSGGEFIPITSERNDITWNQDFKKVMIHTQLQPGKQYAFKIGRRFRTESGYPLDKVYTYIFKTKS